MKEMIKRIREERGGFTLAELLIVVAIVLVLVAIAVPVFTGRWTMPTVLLLELIFTRLNLRLVQRIFLMMKQARNTMRQRFRMMAQ